MNEEKGPQGQDETRAGLAENPLTYADLLQLDWIVEDKIAEWKWRGEGVVGLIEQGEAMLGRIRHAAEIHERSDKEIVKGGRI